MILLDENTTNDERLKVMSRHPSVRQVGFEWGRKSMNDAEIIAVLRSSRRVTFFTRDPDFYRRDWCHPNYCLALIAAPGSLLAELALRFLRHRHFRTHAQRMGKVARLQPSGIVCWAWRQPAESLQPWA